MKCFCLGMKYSVELGQMCLPAKSGNSTYFVFLFFIFKSVYVMMLRSWREVSSHNFIRKSYWTDNCFFPFNLRERRRKRLIDWLVDWWIDWSGVGEESESILPPASLVLEYQQWLRLYQQRLGIQSRFLVGWQKPKYLSHHHCLLESALVGSWSQELELCIQPRCSIWDTRILTDILATKLNTCSW